MPLWTLTPLLPPSNALSTAPALSSALRTAVLESQDESRPSTSTIYLVVFSSPASASSWCPDCRAALPALRAVFGGDGDARAQAYFIEVERDEWRVREDTDAGEKRHFTRGVLGVDSVPTVLKWDLEKGEEVARLDEPACKDEEQLRAFVGGRGEA